MQIDIREVMDNYLYDKQFVSIEKMLLYETYLTEKLCESVKTGNVPVCFDEFYANEYADNDAYSYYKRLSENTSYLFGVPFGIVCQQVNCIGAYGAGISGAIAREYPSVYEDFKTEYEKKKEQFGTHRIIPIGNSLFVANIYSQRGVQSVDNKKVTDLNALVSNIKEIAEKYPHLPVFLPHSRDIEHDGIGCGLGGEKWSNVLAKVKRLPSNNIYILNTLDGRIVCNAKHLPNPPIIEEKQKLPPPPKERQKLPPPKKKKKDDGFER